VTRHVDSGYFNVRKHKGKWRGQVEARGVTLYTSLHAEAWRAAVALEWLLGLWCAKHGEWRGLSRCGVCAIAVGWCAGVPRSEVVSNLPQLQAEDRVGSDGRVAAVVEVKREPQLLDPRLEPKSRVRVVARLISLWMRDGPMSACAGGCGAAGRWRGGGRVAVRAG